MPSVALEQIGDERGRARDLGHLVGPVADEQAEKAVGGVDHREPGPAVAQEVLVERLLDAELAGDRDRLAVHHVGDPQALIRPVIAVCIEAAFAEPLITIPISASQTPPKRSPRPISTSPPPMKR